MDKVSRDIRENIYSQNIMELEEQLYGLNMPLWTFISEDDRYSEEKTDSFIQNIVHDLHESDFLRSFIYVAVRTMTTGYRPYYLMDHERAFPLSDKSAICLSGNEAKSTVGDLVHHLQSMDFEETAGHIYLVLADHPDERVSQYLKQLQKRQWPMNEEEKQEFEDYLKAWHEEHPETEMHARESSDPVLNNFESDDEMEQEYRQACKAYLRQNERMKTMFTAPDHFIRAVETYISHMDSHLSEYGHYYSSSDDSAVIYGRIKQFMMHTSYTMFDQREKMIAVNANLIRARMTVFGKQGGRS